MVQELTKGVERAQEEAKPAIAASCVDNLRKLKEVGYTGKLWFRRPYDVSEEEGNPAFYEMNEGNLYGTFYGSKTFFGLRRKLVTREIEPDEIDFGMYNNFYQLLDIAVKIEEAEKSLKFHH